MSRTDWFILIPALAAWLFFVFAFLHWGVWKGQGGTGTNTKQYEVRFDPAQGGVWFYTTVLYHDEPIARKTVCYNYKRAARWANRRIKNHQAGIRLVGT